MFPGDLCIVDFVCVLAYKAVILSEAFSLVGRLQPYFALWGPTSAHAHTLISVEAQ